MGKNVTFWIINKWNYSVIVDEWKEKKENEKKSNFGEQKRYVYRWAMSEIRWKQNNKEEIKLYQQSTHRQTFSITLSCKKIM